MKFYPMKGASAGFMYFGFFAALCIIGIVFFPVARVVLIILLVVCLLGINDFHRARFRFLLTLNITEQGVSRYCYMSNKLFIPWRECLYIGICKNSSDKYPTNWICVSKIQLSEKCINNIRKINYRSSIIIQYRPEILDEILKHVDRDQIRNLYLLNNKQ